MESDSTKGVSGQIAKRVRRLRHPPMRPIPRRQWSIVGLLEDRVKEADLKLVELQQAIEGLQETEQEELAYIWAVAVATGDKEIACEVASLVERGRHLEPLNYGSEELLSALDRETDAEITFADAQLILEERAIAAASSSRAKAALERVTRSSDFALRSREARSTLTEHEKLSDRLAAVSPPDPGDRLTCLHTPNAPNALRRAILCAA